MPSKEILLEQLYKDWMTLYKSVNKTTTPSPTYLPVERTTTNTSLVYPWLFSTPMVSSSSSSSSSSTTYIIKEGKQEEKKSEEKKEEQKTSALAIASIVVGAIGVPVVAWTLGNSYKMYSLTSRIQRNCKKLKKCELSDEESEIVELCRRSVAGYSFSNKVQYQGRIGILLSLVGMGIGGLTQSHPTMFGGFIGALGSFSYTLFASNAFDAEDDIIDINMVTQKFIQLMVVKE